MIHPFIGVTLVLGFLLGLLNLLKWFQNRYQAHPEVLRKTLHVVMGSICMSFLWLFKNIWPVIVLAVLAGMLLFAIKRLNLKHESLGSVFCAINRKSYGELCFSAGVGIVYCLAVPDPLLYILPVLILTISDALAALIGAFYGKWRYVTLAGTKSFEGSAAFFVSANFCTFIALMLSGISIVKSGAIALIVAYIVTLVEAISGKGYDNLLIPLTVYVLLKISLSENFMVLGLMLGAISVLVVAWLVLASLLHKGLVKSP